MKKYKIWPHRARYATRKWWWLVNNGWSVGYATKHWFGYIFGDMSI